MIDWTRLNTLRDEIGPDSFDEVVMLFLEEVDESIDKLRAGLPQADLGAELHFLKGCALNLGFTEFANLCQKGENSCSIGQSDQVDTAQLLAVFDRSRSAFVNGLGLPT